jgi:ABC-type nitrate/sulfonate/bicarbonate transport system permease component
VLIDFIPQAQAGAVSGLRDQPDPAAGGDRAAGGAVVRLRLTPKILLVALVTFFPMLIALVDGYDSTDQEIEALLASMGASRAGIFRRARLPSAMPYFFAGLRISITYAVVAAIFAEYVGARAGLGIVILNAKNSFRPDLMLAAVVISSALTLALFGATALMQRIVLGWRHAGAGR